MKLLLLLCGFVLFGNVQAGELYRSIDSSGKVHYGDKPLSSIEDVELLKLGNEPVPDDSLPYETKKAQENFPVVLYVFETCGVPCDEARQFLQKRGIPFTEKNLVTKEDVDTFRTASGSEHAPSMTVGKTWVIGFLAERWHKELDFAGYPKTAPYRAHPVTAAPTQTVKPAP